MIKVWELTTQNGRVFRTTTENKNQEKRLKVLIAENKQKEYEKFTTVSNNVSGLHSLKEFEKIAKTLV